MAVQARVSAFAGQVSQSLVRARQGTVTLSVTIPAMRKIFKTRHFSRWMRKTELTDQTLCAAVVAMEAGLDEICDDNQE
ncbi:type II toxin-antitoxin system RelE/ParE family toxin [uncultured Lamprocystis sp.]|uniref:type II toxin-antitoxin system RelE/ParE family toxin n=1 Tax=uncultured Lamprocystis sp. TaxID=543132 RepID=UPI00343165E9